jgi:hypothetical protein
MTMKCPLGGCGKEFQPYDGMRTTARDGHWCKECQDDFDSTDWDTVNEERRALGRMNDITYGEFFK